MLLGCIQEEPVTTEPNDSSQEQKDFEVVSFVTGRDSYGSSEEADFMIEVYSPEKINSTIMITGVSPYGRPKMKEIEEQELNKGMNSIVIKSKTPSCTTGCGGVKPGNYTMTLKVTAGKKILLENTTISLHA